MTGHRTASHTKLHLVFAAFLVLLTIEAVFFAYFLASTYTPRATDRVGLTQILTEHQPIPGNRTPAPRPGGLRQAIVEDLGMTIDEFAVTRPSTRADAGNVEPGSQLEFIKGNVGVNCSLGAWIPVYGQSMLFTAGHCRPPTKTLTRGSSWNQNDTPIYGNQNDTRRYVVATGGLSVLHGDHDVLAASTRGDNFNSVMLTNGRSVDLSVEDPTPRVGEPVCANGRTTGWRCGILLSDGPALSATFCSDGGDSGGVIIQGNRIIGMVTRAVEAGIVKSADNKPICTDPSRSQGTYNTGRRDTPGSYGVRLDTSIEEIKKVLN